MALIGFIYWLINLLREELFLLTCFITKLHRKLYVLFSTLPRDIRFAKQVTELTQVLKEQAGRDETIYSAFLRLAVSHPKKICFRTDEKDWTYRQVEEFANRVAQVLSAAGFRKGDVIALVMGNRVEYMCVRLGMAQLGVIAALVNTNLRGRPLEHIIESVCSKAVIVDGDYSGTVDVSRTQGRLPSVSTVYQLGGDLVKGSNDLDALVAAASSDQPVVAHPPGYNDIAAYFYTSGTSGLPKACILLHSRLLIGPAAVKILLDLNPDHDLMYTCMPLYHMAGGGYGAGLATVVGVPVAIARKFSATRFWADCAKFNATCSQYIGEMCRFLMMQPVQLTDRRHNVRTLIGNGLRPSLRKPFQERFGVPLIVELYGSTEGNFNLLNLVDNKAGALGFIPRCLPLSWSPVAIVRVNEVTGELIRGADGFCQRCDEGETGMGLGRISHDHPGRTFIGYIDKEATDEKIARNVFKRSDKWFISGDLLMMDEFGYVYFKDRVGDTFRWKGENVATAEVENEMKHLIPSKDVAVFGVQIPGTEGRCGMAAIEDTDGTVDQNTLNTLADGMKYAIPSYARPLFIRIVPILPINGTYKVLKNMLQKEGYDPQKVSDPLYFLDPKTSRYIPLTDEVMEKLRSNHFKI